MVKDDYAILQAATPRLAHCPWAFDGNPKLHRHVSSHWSIASMAWRRFVRCFHCGASAGRFPGDWRELPCDTWCQARKDHHLEAAGTSDASRSNGFERLTEWLWPRKPFRACLSQQDNRIFGRSRGGLSVLGHNSLKPNLCERRQIERYCKERLRASWCLHKRRAPITS